MNCFSRERNLKALIKETDFVVQYDQQVKVKKITVAIVVFGLLILGYVVFVMSFTPTAEQNMTADGVSPHEQKESAELNQNTYVGVERMLALIQDGNAVVCDFSQTDLGRSQSIAGTFYHAPDGRFRINATVTDGDIQYEAYTVYDTTTIFFWSSNPDILPDFRESYGAGEGISFYNVTIEELEQSRLLDLEAEYRCQAKSFDLDILTPPERFFSEYPY